MKAKNQNILIVEDDPSLRMSEKRFLERLLENEGFEKFDIDTAENGKVGLDKVTEKNYDLILSDYRMPVMDGFEFYQNLSLEQQKRLVFVSGTPELLKEKFESEPRANYRPPVLNKVSLYKEKQIILSYLK